jgi:hypothetical protein
MRDNSERPPLDESYVLAARDYSEIAHLENPSVIERVLSTSRAEATAYVGKLLQTGAPRYILAGPKVAFTAMVIEALTDLGNEVAAWVKAGDIPKDFSGRPAGYQTWVDLLQEIDSNPIDVERLKALKAMFLAANRVKAKEGESIAAYQLFQIAKRLTSGQFLLLKAAHERATEKDFRPDPRIGAKDWLRIMSQRLGHEIEGLVELDERVLMQNGLLTDRSMSDQSGVNDGNGRLTLMAFKFCENLRTYSVDLRSSGE